MTIHEVPVPESGRLRDDLVAGLKALNAAGWKRQPGGCHNITFYSGILTGIKAFSDL